MACAAPPSPLPVVSLSARRRSATAAYYHAPSSRLSSGNSPRSRLRAEASKAEPVEENLPAAPAPSEPLPQPRTSTWNWKGYNIRYQCAGTSGPALVLIHGFGANSDHWRKNIPVLAMANRVYAIDLIGYGYSDKPNPREFEESFYTFETWGEQLNTFCAEVVKSDAFFICNSIGGLVGLQAAVMEPQTCKGIVLLDISLRMLHINKQPWFGRPVSLPRTTTVHSTPIPTTSGPASQAPQRIPTARPGRVVASATPIENAAFADRQTGRRMSRDPAAPPAAAAAGYTLRPDCPDRQQQQQQQELEKDRTCYRPALHFRDARVAPEAEAPSAYYIPPFNGIAAVAGGYSKVGAAARMY